MYVIKKVAARQGHPVPSSASYAQGPFPRELFASPEVINPYTSDVEDNFEFSNSNEDEWFLCYHCDEAIYYLELNDHECE
jgi:hypothetical protein